MSTTPPETAFTRILGASSTDEIADERLERGLRRADQDVVLEHPLRAERRDRDDRRALRHLRRGGPRELQQRPGVRVHRPVPVLVLGLERRADHAGRGVVHEHVERPERGDLVEHALGRDVAAHEHDLGPERRAARRRSPPPRGRCGGSRSRSGRRRPCANRRAMARPMPREPPVTKTFTAGAGAAGPPAPTRGARPSRCARRLALALLRLRRGVAEVVEALHLRVGVAAHLVVGRQAVRRARGHARGSGRRSAGVAGPTRASTSSRVGSRSIGARA